MSILIKNRVHNYGRNFELRKINFHQRILHLIMIVNCSSLNAYTKYILQKCHDVIMMTQQE
jgi:hypothetical protein